MADATSKDHVRTPKSSRAKVTYPGGEHPKELVDKLTELEQQYGVDLVNLIGQRSGAADGLGQPTPGARDDYPVRLYAPDKYDSSVQMKQQLIKAAGGNANATPFGQAVMTAQDMDWLAKKRDQMTAAQFKQFVSGMYNKNDPAQAALLHKVYPELLEEQKQILEDRIDLIKRLAMMKLYGQPRDKEDLRLLFALSSGAVTPPTGNLWDPSTWSQYDANPGNADGNEIKRGLFSATKRYQSGFQAKAKVPFDQLMSVIGTPYGGSGTPAPGGSTFNAPGLMGTLGL